MLAYWAVMLYEITVVFVIMILKMIVQMIVTVNLAVLTAYLIMEMKLFMIIVVFVPAEIQSMLPTAIRMTAATVSEIMKH